jgi:IS30 family transposase
MTIYTHLSCEDRDRLAELRAMGMGTRAAARELGRSPSTISRELRRNALPRGCYRPDYADGSYLHRRQRRAILEQDCRLRDYVVARLSEGWTPEQIAGRLKSKPEKGLRHICHETIYAFVYRNDQKTEKLWKFLVRRRAKRRPLRARAARDGIKDKVHIDARSTAANERMEPGHWEGDLVICKRSKPVLVLHERKTRITLMARLLGKTAGETVASIQAVFKRLEPAMRGSITFDNGTEFAQHALLRGMLKATTYFCDAYASWQKGGVENANGRIRRWLPRSTDLDELTDQDIQDIAMTINLTPRKCLGYKTPVEAFLAELGKHVEIRFA